MAFHCFFACVSAIFPSAVVRLKKSETNSNSHDLTVQYLGVGSYLAASRRQVTQS